MTLHVYPCSKQVCTVRNTDKTFEQRPPKGEAGHDLYTQVVFIWRSFDIEINKGFLKCGLYLQGVFIQRWSLTQI